ETDVTEQTAEPADRLLLEVLDDELPQLADERGKALRLLVGVGHARSSGGGQGGKPAQGRAFLSSTGAARKHADLVVEHRGQQLETGRGTLRLEHPLRVGG